MHSNAKAAAGRGAETRRPPDKSKHRWPLRQLAHACNKANTRYGYLAGRDGILACCFTESAAQGEKVWQVSMMPVMWTQHGDQRWGPGTPPLTIFIRASLHQPSTSPAVPYRAGRPGLGFPTLHQAICQTFTQELCWDKSKGIPQHDQLSTDKGKKAAAVTWDDESEEEDHVS
ncbi:hypothetical protein GGTG_09175 [Gaeumannomyces tritici R3-111a-1]|uniref:Uncharacterized protein n=1 Tax=Gaeumannomyces tritici (strain R3-111a-1) TaxID=644352 RepID=J3P6N3_GAET3|nr:hypothetical protein GGTG_09175 [Gaeumannomyces tritici R3-111a-1]EJT72309.1 hypothetical protein GGTG_09175 [Gaeumannomyces tritici R3-111a-1]